MGTALIGPDDIDHAYDQVFSSNTWVNAPYSPTGPDPSLVYGFLIRRPTDALSAEFRGSAGASAAAVGRYVSTANCGALDLQITLPIPPGVVCKNQLGPCDPGCEGVGEMVVCQPAHAKLSYSARSSANCGTPQVPAQGSWVLTLTSVAPVTPGDTYLHYQAHGNLTATLVNQEDPSDSVVLNLDF